MKRGLTNRVKRALGVAFAVAFVGVLLITAENCGTYKNNNSGNGALQFAPGLIRVYNGSTLAFYTRTGGYGFQTQTASVMTMPQNFGTGQQFAQNTNDGFLYFGSTSCSGSCDYVISINGYTGGFRSGMLSSAETSLNLNGVTTGLALDVTTNTIFAADSANGRVNLLNASNGVMAAGPIVPPNLLGAKFVGVDTNNHRGIFSETTHGAVWVMDNGQNVITTSPAILTLTSAGCTAANVSKVVVNSLSHLAYVLCGSSIVYLYTSGTPTYQNGSASASTFALANMTAATDLVYESGGTMVVAAGSHFVTGIDSGSGAARTTTDLSGGDCTGAAMDLEGIAYDSGSSTLFVADAANSKVYLLDAGTLNFKNGTCTASSFSTPDVSAPSRISFF